MYYNCRELEMFEFNFGRIIYTERLVSMKQSLTVI